MGECPDSVMRAPSRCLLDDGGGAAWCCRGRWIVLVKRIKRICSPLREFFSRVVIKFFQKKNFLSEFILLT